MRMDVSVDRSRQIGLCFRHVRTCAHRSRESGHLDPTRNASHVALALDATSPCSGRITLECPLILPIGN